MLPLGDRTGHERNKNDCRYEPSKSRVIWYCNEFSDNSTLLQLLNPFLHSLVLWTGHDLTSKTVKFFGGGSVFGLALLAMRLSLSHVLYYGALTRLNSSLCIFYIHEPLDGPLQTCRRVYGNDQPMPFCTSSSPLSSVHVCARSRKRGPDSYLPRG